MTQARKTAAGKKPAAAAKKPVARKPAAAKKAKPAAKAPARKKAAGAVKAAAAAVAEPAVATKVAAPAKPQATIATSAGVIRIELWPDKAPRHVENFVNLARKGSYDNLVFHRVIPKFMIQTGDVAGTGSGRSGGKLAAEFNDARFVKGVVGMARGAHRDSAGTQFFICVADSPHLNGSYTAFGRVIAGQEVADQISQVEAVGHRPVKDVRMTKVTITAGED